jgi:hypothetical protein
MMKNIFYLFFAFIACFSCKAQNQIPSKNNTIINDNPKLVVGIVVDQIINDY